MPYINEYLFVYDKPLYKKYKSNHYIILTKVKNKDNTIEVWDVMTRTKSGWEELPKENKRSLQNEKNMEIRAGLSKLLIPKKKATK